MVNFRKSIVLCSELQLPLILTRVRSLVLFDGISLLAHRSDSIVFDVFVHTSIEKRIPKNSSWIFPVFLNFLIILYLTKEKYFEEKLLNKWKSGNLRKTTVTLWFEVWVQRRWNNEHLAGKFENSKHSYIVTYYTVFCWIFRSQKKIIRALSEAVAQNDTKRTVTVLRWTISAFPDNYAFIFDWPGKHQNPRIIWRRLSCYLYHPLVI